MDWHAIDNTQRHICQYIVNWSLGLTRYWQDAATDLSIASIACRFIHGIDNLLTRRHAMFANCVPIHTSDWQAIGMTPRHACYLFVNVHVELTRNWQCTALGFWFACRFTRAIDTQVTIDTAPHHNFQLLTNSIRGRAISWQASDRNSREDIPPHRQLWFGSDRLLTGRFATSRHC